MYYCEYEKRLEPKVEMKAEIGKDEDLLQLVSGAYDSKDVPLLLVGMFDTQIDLSMNNSNYSYGNVWHVRLGAEFDNCNGWRGL